MGNEGYEVPLTSVGAKLASDKILNGDEPYTTRIIDNMAIQIDDRMPDERITDRNLSR